MLAAIAIKIGVVSVSRLCRCLLAVATIVTVAILPFAIAPRTAHAADTGAITVDGTVATRYDAYQLFRRPLSTMTMLAKRLQPM